MKTTPGDWSFACDSYGKVRHSKKACVYSVVTEYGAERIVKIAGHIENWDDARVIAAARDTADALARIATLAMGADKPAARLAAIARLCVVPLLKISGKVPKVVLDEMRAEGEG